MQFFAKSETLSLWISFVI